MNMHLVMSDNELSIKLTNTRPHFFELQTSDHITVKDYLPLLLTMYSHNALEQIG